MIRKIEFDVLNGVVEEAVKTYVIKFFLKFRKNPVTMWLRTDMKKIEVLRVLLSLVENFIILSDNE